jgi:thioredoxin 1
MSDNLKTSTNILTSGIVQEIKDMEQFKDIVSKKMTVVDYTALWCGPCKKMKPVFKKLASEFSNVNFCSVDVDECEDVAAYCKIVAMPTFQVWSAGNMVEQMTGANEKSLVNLITKHVNLFI